MSWIALVGPELEENLSLRYLASSLTQAGFEARIVRFDGAEDFARASHAIALAAEPPLLVGVSLAFQWRAPDFLALVVGLRELGYRGHVTVGGHFATFAAAPLLTDFPVLDSVCRQEAEHTLVELCQRVQAGEPWADIPGVVSRGADGVPHFAPLPDVPELAALPPPVRSEPARCFGHGIAPVVSSRGCYANCSFCCIAAWHEQTLPGKRYRLRDVRAVASEMMSLRREQGVDIFVFHDDNFFIPSHEKSLARIHALADALEAEGLRGYATVVKARPNDVHPDVFRALVERLHCIRCYVGIETDADQGLVTLRRWAQSSQNHRAIEVARSLELFVCFNLLMFDPDTTLTDVRRNVEFIEYASDYPFNFGRVELYAGTPLLARMQAEGRCRGDYLQWDYDLGSPEVQRYYDLAMRCFMPRNFGGDALANTIQGLRFDLEIVRHLHPEVHDPALYREGRALTQRLARDSAGALRELLDHVTTRPRAADEACVSQLAPRLREVEAEVTQHMRALAGELQRRVGRGVPLTLVGDRVATPLMRAVPPELEA